MATSIIRNLLPHLISSIRRSEGDVALITEGMVFTTSLRVSGTLVLKNTQNGVSCFEHTQWLATTLHEKFEKSISVSVDVAFVVKTGDWVELETGALVVPALRLLFRDPE